MQQAAPSSSLLDPPPIPSTVAIPSTVPPSSKQPHPLGKLPDTIKPHHLDILQLLVRYLLHARPSPPPSSTAPPPSPLWTPSLCEFKQTWKELGFSHIFHAVEPDDIPTFIAEIYNFLLAVIKGATLPPLELEYLPLIASQRNDQQVQKQKQKKDGNCIAPSLTVGAEPSIEDEALPKEPTSTTTMTPKKTNIKERLEFATTLESTTSQDLPPLTTHDIAWIKAHVPQGPQIVSAGVFALYCTYYAQPNTGSIKIRISKEEQQTLLGLAHYLHHTRSQEALLLFRQLLRDKAFIPSSFQHAKGPSNGVEAETLLPGVGATRLATGLRGPEAVLVREARFHFRSTLTGLGTAHLDPLFRGYEEKMKKLWTALGAGGGGGGESGGSEKGAMPEGIADLSVGKWVHEYAVGKSKETNIVVEEGKYWRTFRERGKKRKEEREEEKKQKKKKKDLESASGGGGDAIVPVENGEKEGERESGGGKAKKRQRPRMPREQPQKRKEKYHMVGGVNMKMIQAREVARQADIARRKTPWVQWMGVDPEEDMPLIPGMESKHAYLAGPSGLLGATTTEEEEELEEGEEGDGTSSDDGSVHPRQGQSNKKKKKGSGTGKWHVLASSLASSESSDTESSFSDDEEEEASVKQGGRRKTSGAAATAATAAAKQKKTAAATTAKQKKEEAQERKKKEWDDTQRQAQDIHAILATIEDGLHEADELLK